jgi:hypothetical protein
MYELSQPNKLQEIGDTIFVVEATDTPVMAMLKRGSTPKQMLSEWPVKFYEDQEFDGTPDGDDIAEFSKTDRDKIQGYAMWQRSKGWFVSKLANLTRSAGVKGKEAAEQMASDAVKLALRMEKQVCSDQDTQQEGGGKVYRSRGIFSWLSESAQGVLPVPANYRPPSGSTYTGAVADFSPASMEGLLEAAAERQNSRVDLVFPCGIKLKRQMSTWAQRDPDAEADEAAALVAYNQDAGAKRILQIVNFFEFDAGSVKAMAHFRLLCDVATGAKTAKTSRSGAGLSLKMWEVAYLQAPTNWQEPPKSGGPRGYHDSVYILKCLMPAGQIAVVCSS